MESNLSEILKNARKDIKKQGKTLANKDIPTTYEQEETQKIKVNEILNSLTADQKEKTLLAIKRKKARENYIDYLKMVYPNYIWTPFHTFLAQICDNVVKRIEKGEKCFIILSVPPRHGKSETVTKTLPSWFVGRNPDLNAILTAYNADLAEKFEDANRQKTREFGKDIFDIEISDAQDNKTLYQIKNHRGGVMGVGVMGGITGNGGELIIIDDPYKNSVDANSETTRRQLEQVYRDSIATRLQGKGNAIILIQTRWHEDDLAGKLAKTQENAIVINIPCVCENEKTDPLTWLDSKGNKTKRKVGQTLCPELGYDTEWAIAQQKNVGLKVWNALYQGKPTIDGGDIFTRDMVRFYTKSSLPLQFDEETISCDLSFGGIKQCNDPCSIQVWGRLGANHYLLKRIKKRFNFNEMCNMIKIISGEFPLARKKIVEKKANGQAVIDSLNSVIGGFVAFDPKMIDKVGRANAITPYLQSGNVFLPSSDIDSSIDEMVEEMMKFPNGSHDDEVDAMTQYLNCYSYKNGGKVCVDSFYSTLADAVRGIKI